MTRENVVKLKCSETGDIIYAKKNKKRNPNKLELKKYNPKLRKRTVHLESKK